MAVGLRPSTHVAVARLCRASMIESTVDLSWFTAFSMRRTRVFQISDPTVEGITSIPRGSKFEASTSRDRLINRRANLAHLQSNMDQAGGRQSGNVYAIQRKLMAEHHKAKSKVHSSAGVGGGVSMWPSMDDMRLTRREANLLVLFCGVLILGTMSIFLICHGKRFWTNPLKTTLSSCIPILNNAVGTCTRLLLAN